VSHFGLKISPATLKTQKEVACILGLITIMMIGLILGDKDRTPALPAVVWLQLIFS
jgi:hypothetical protein